MIATNATRGDIGLSRDNVNNLITSGKGANRSINATANGWFFDDPSANVRISISPNFALTGSKKRHLPNRKVKNAPVIQVESCRML